MRRRLILVALVLAACAKTDQPKADTVAAAPPPAPPPPAPIALADVAGTWNIKTMPMGKDTVLTTSVLTATSTMNGWSQKLPNGANPKVKVVSVAGDSIVSEAGPFASAVRKGQRVSIHTISRLHDGMLMGVIHAKYSNGDTATFRFEGTKAAPKATKAAPKPTKAAPTGTKTKGTKKAPK